MRNEHQASSSSSPRRSKSKTRRPGRSTPRRDRSNLFEIFPLEKRVLLSGTPTTFDHTFRYLVAPALTPAPSPHVTGSATPVGLNAAQIRGAYGVDNISFSNGALGTGAGITIAIIDAYDTPSIIGDLHTF
ncbi:MAG TPA: LEPR-XLL domain-containing protein, partial [Tepidisphaeraceae bacterium]|nr:LEPR-XLL domain-containing protein [Tepidisphaeraceae bacterium]